jgi:fibronectin-binding autotransporter adhesin
VLSGGSGLELGGIYSPTLTLNSDATQAGRLLLGGNLVVNSTLTDGTAQILSGGSGAVPGSIDLNGGTRTLTINDGLHATDMLITAAISNGALTKDGAGSLVLTGTNSYSGGTATLAVATNASLGSSAITLDGSAESASVLQFSSGSGGATYANNITVSANQGVLNNTSGGTVTLSGTLTKDGSVLVLQGGTFNITGTISGSSANSDLVVDNSTTTLSSANSYNGPTYIINGGTLNANSTGALPTDTRSDIIMDVTGTGSSNLTLGASQQIASLSGTSTSTVALGANTLTVGAGGAISVDTSNTVFKVVFGAGVDMSDDFWSTPWVTHTWAMTSIFGKAFFAGAFQSVQTNLPLNPLGSFTINGDSLTYSTVPEPSGVLAGLLLVAGLLRRRR